MRLNRGDSDRKAEQFPAAQAQDAGIDTSAASAYAEYALNRDGRIDSIDVAYILVSWGR